MTVETLKYDAEYAIITIKNVVFRYFSSFGEMKMKQRFVFISHSNHPSDVDICERLYKYLGACGVCCWMDREDMHSGSWKEQIVEKLLDASAFILVESIHSLQSPQVKKEINLMTSTERPLIPFALDEYCLSLDKEKGSALYELGVGELQTVFLNRYPQESYAFEKLLSYLPPEVICFKNDPTEFHFDSGGKVLEKYVGHDSFVEIPGFVQAIADGAFRNNSDLVTVYIPDSVERIGRRAFLGCSALSRVDGMRGIIDVDNSAFNYTNLVSGDGKPFVVNGILFGSALANDAILPSARMIASNAFYGCEAEELIFADGLISVGEGAFMDSFLRRIVFPVTLKRIGMRAFASCTRLKEVVFLGQVPDNATLIFDQEKIKEKK